MQNKKPHLHPDLSQEDEHLAVDVAVLAAAIRTAHAGILKETPIHHRDKVDPHLNTLLDVAAKLESPVVAAE